MNDPFQPHILLEDYPRLILDEFGLDSVDGAFYVKTLKENFILFLKGFQHKI